MVLAENNSSFEKRWNVKTNQFYDRSEYEKMYSQWEKFNEINYISPILL